MEKYESILKKATASLRKAQLETKELYAKHTFDLLAMDGTGRAFKGSEADALRKQIEKETGLHFDLVNHGEGISAKNKFVRVIKKKKSSKSKEMGGELADHIANSSKSTVSVVVPDDEKAELNFLFLSGEQTLPLEIVIDAGRNSKLRLFEWYGSASEGKGTVSSLHAIKAGKNSDVEVNVLHNENSKTSVGIARSVLLSERSRLALNTIYKGGFLTKSTTNAEAGGKCSELFVNDIVFGEGDQKFDVLNLMLNSGESTRIVMRSGAALREKAYCALKGYAKVAKSAKESYSKVEENGLLVDSGARIELLPDMSVDCKDVAFAAHGSASAPLDEEVLFYLKSRGLDEARAKKAMVASFLAKYLSGIGSNIVKTIAMTILLDKLDGKVNSQAPRIGNGGQWIFSEKVKE